MKNKIVLITGGSSGIGAATALLFAGNNYDVAFVYKTNKKGADDVVNKIEKLGKKVLALQADLSNEVEVKNVVNEVLEEFGIIDVLVNNAGRYIDGDEWDGSSEVWLKSFQQNIVSMMIVSRYVSQIFIKQKKGVMINISSRHGLDGQYDAISYAAAKAGVINITQSYAKLLHPFGRANSISPAATKAGYWLSAPKDELEQLLADKPNHKLVEPEVVANKVLYLASDETKNINGQNYIVNE